MTDVLPPHPHPLVHWVRRLRRALTRNRAYTAPGHPDPRLRGRLYPLPFDEVWAAALHLASALPRWRVTRSDVSTGTLRAEARTRLWRFVDDVELHILPEGEGTTRVDLRSASRVGRTDLGANARRIARFLQKLDDRLRPRSPPAA